MLKDFRRQSLAALRILIVFTVILGVAYPTAVWGVGKAFGDNGQGQPVEADGVIVGSAMLGQNFKGDLWFHSRPSANDYDSLASGPSNLGPSNSDLIKTINDRRTQIAKTESVDPSDVPPDAITASGSGLDPHISVAYAEIQIARVARANGVSNQTVRRLVAENTDGRSLGFLGEPGVNVLRLNLAVQSAGQGAD